MTLPPYNPDAKCPKCGGGEVSTSVLKLDPDGPGFVALAPEDAHHVCRSCGYAWPEAPMDHIADVSKMVGEDG